jgi:hypothetical protein
MRIRIEASQLPGRSCGPSPQRPEGHHNVHVAVQRRGKPGELLGLVPGDAPSATWTLECTAAPDGTDIMGPYIQGAPGGRFIYLSWGVVGDDGTFAMFRRAKLWLTGIAPEVVTAAGADGVLIARLGLTDPKGNPTCASVRPPLIEWSAAAGQAPAGGQPSAGRKTASASASAE